MDAPKTPEPPTPPATDDAARRHEAAHNRLFLLRIALTLIALAVYLLSGASERLANGLGSRFGSFWPVVNGLYTLVTVFGFATLMFPVSLYADFVLEHRFNLSKQTLESWFLDYLKSLAIELVVATAFFEAIYVFLRYAPEAWWIWATLFYVLFAVVLTSIAPVVIMPLFHKFEPLNDAALSQAVRAFAERAGLKVVGVFRWGLEEKTHIANAALAGLGRTRRIILADTMLGKYTTDEIVAVLAHEVGHYKHRDLLRLIVSGTALAALGFYIAKGFLQGLVASFGFSGPSDIAGFPLLVFCLFLFSLLTLPFSNLYSRRREFAADAYAVRAVGSAAALASALDKLASQNLADRDPPPWIECLLHSHPSIRRRVEQARAVEKTLSPP